MRKIRVGGVPEHFNLPWHLANEKGLFKDLGIELDWIVYDGGTGAMTKALRENQTDLCILLTEGIVSDIVHGNPASIVSKYIETPLVWGIHTGAGNNLSAHEDIYQKRYAISRIGSGSHLMAKVDAFYNQVELEESQFHIIKNLNGALTSLESLDTDVFYWEKFTTKPYVDKGVLKRIGEYPTPWPCFVIAATDDILEKNPELVKDTLSVIYRMNKDFMDNPNAVKMVSSRYQQKEEDVLEWFGSTMWSTSNQIAESVIDKVIFTLQKAGVLKEGQTLPFDQIVKPLW
ncbi:MAG: substrate-binding domain-containing protein [Bacteroidota bacterium]